ncbi:MAG TPA: hypothetical protein PK110_15425 [Niabella sp.]|nr:hypothetical protein [Niabella sp.]
MAKEFYIKKQSGTYTEALEAFGVANLLYEILERSKQIGYKITIKDLGQSYLAETNKDITDELIQALPYFQVIKFIKKETNTPIPAGITDYFDYPTNKAEQDRYKTEFKRIESDKTKNAEQKRAARKALNDQKLSEFGRSLDAEYDVYREIKLNPYTSFTNLFNNFHQNQDRFQELIKTILNYYSTQQNPMLNFQLVETSPTAQQLYNPNQGKGLNKAKANNASMGNLDGFWIPETMKISGALSFMVSQYVKVGSGYDLKIYVPEFNEINLREARQLIFDFKKYLKSASPVKLDILNSLNFTIKFIQHTPVYTGKVRRTIKGFHSVYQKDLGQNKAVANISFVGTPDFVSYTNRDEGHEWIEILENQRNLISKIDEQGDAMQGLQNYRNFIGGTGNSALEYFNDFSYWYAGYLMQKLSKGNRFVKTFEPKHLTKFYKNMNTQELSLSSIIENDGFQAVAKAIRYSTVKIQYNKEYWEKKVGLKTRYGLAQELQNKAKSKEDLATFIGEFIGTYNAETARNAEKNDGKAFRANVKDEELVQFYSLLDSKPARLIGALLASYGFALNKKEAPKDEEQDDETNEENEQ